MAKIDFGKFDIGKEKPSMSTLDKSDKSEDVTSTKSPTPKSSVSTSDRLEAPSATPDKSEKSEDGTSPKSPTPSSPLSTSDRSEAPSVTPKKTSSTERDLVDHPDDFPKLPSTAMQVSQVVSPRATENSAPGPAGSTGFATKTSTETSSRLATATYRWKIEPTPSACFVGVEALETGTRVPDPNAPGEFMTINNVVTTKCFNTVREKGSLATLTKTAGETVSRTVQPLALPITADGGHTHTETRVAMTLVTTTSALTTIASSTAIGAGTASPTSTPVAANHGLSAALIAVIVFSVISGVLALGALAFFILRRLQKRKEAHHGAVSRFWRFVFAPSQPQGDGYPLSDLKGEAPAPPSLADGYVPRDPTARSEPSNFPKPHASGFVSFKDTVAAKAPIVASSKFPVLFSDRDVREAKRAQAQIERNAADKTADVDLDDEFGLGKGEQSSEFVEVCLDEFVALEEQEKAERRQTEGTAAWSSEKRPMSLFAKMP
jgi:hypothetical protein